MKNSLVSTQRGMSLALALIISACLVFLILGLADISKTFVRQANYMQQMDRTIQLAESGLNTAASLLSKSPEAYNVAVELGGRNGECQYVPEMEGSYGTLVAVRNNPLPGIYYIITTASRTVSGRTYTVLLHTYARISNAGEYFAAINDTVMITHPMDLANARVYGLSLQFQRQATYTDNGNTVNGSNTPGQTVIKNADFLNDCWPSVDCSGPDCEWANGAQAAAISADLRVTQGGPNFVPTKLNAPILLPQILPSDILYYQNLAGPHNTVSDFTTHIFPPGYNTPIDILDPYAAGHSVANADHVYFRNGPVRVRGTVHGQVLIVSTDDIFITGNIVSAPLGEVPPGTGALASTAHQLVLIPGPGKKVIISDEVYQVGQPDPQTVTIEALVLCPNGTIQPLIAAPNRTKLKLQFTGSMILGQRPDFATYFDFPAVFPDVPRRYAYMPTLETNPPPYLPSIIEIYHSIREVKTE